MTSLWKPGGKPSAQFCAKLAATMEKFLPRISKLPKDTTSLHENNDPANHANINKI
jgi:hypothetical protein